MLKIKLIIALLKKHFSWTLILSLLLFLGYRELVRKNGLREKDRIITTLKKVHLDQLLKVKGAYHVIAEKNDSLRGIALAQQQIIFQLKHVTATGTTVQIEEDSNRVRVPFWLDTLCFSIEGWTKTNPPEYFLDVATLPIGVEVFITDIGDEVHGVITPAEESWLNIVDVKFDASPDIKGGCKDGFDKGEFILGSALIGCGVIIYNFLK